MAGNKTGGGTRHTIVSCIATAVCVAVWPVVSKFSSEQFEPIASSVSTIAGILLGFVMASITLFASATENTLIRNTSKTGYLDELANRLHMTMGMLLAVCITFLIVLFLPDDLTFLVGEGGEPYRYASVVVTVGVFLLIHSFVNFFMAWREFRKFVRFM